MNNIGDDLARAYEEGYNDGYSDGVEKRQEQVDAAPTIDAAPVVHAYWEGHCCDEDLNRGDWRICTACGHDEWGKAEDGSNYCPACGARMDADAPERVGEGQ